MQLLVRFRTLRPVDAQAPRSQQAMITTPTPLQRWAFELLGVAHRHGLT